MASALHMSAFGGEADMPIIVCDNVEMQFRRPRPHNPKNSLISEQTLVCALKGGRSLCVGPNYCVSARSDQPAPTRWALWRRNSDPTLSRTFFAGAEDQSFESLKRRLSSCSDVPHFDQDVGSPPMTAKTTRGLECPVTKRAPSGLSFPVHQRRPMLWRNFSTDLDAIPPCEANAS